ncbi:Flagellar hook-associated protein FlgL [hydrothermal vent metagenome]|uniref:Flagellar hook-associated protein FlgL n=1 Tax=hydrothermal vent metagenome TaxID=652676 RepID=A0A3B1AL40_9ZZZZ
MALRVSTSQFHKVAVDSMLEQQKKLSKIQQQVATGRKIHRPSDDPVASAKIVKLNDILKTSDQFQSNIVAARAKLTLEESALADVVEVYHRVRELTIQANNASQTNETRSFIAEEISQLLDEVVGLANAADSNGEFLFSGNKGKFKPFSKNSTGGYDYSGDDGQRLIQIGPRRRVAINDSGSDVFREIRDGNGKFNILEGKLNQGSGVSDPGTVTGNYNMGTYAIQFDRKDSINPEEPVTYSVVDDKGKEILPAGQKYIEGASIDFAGIHTFIKGQPEPGDYFVVRPSFHQDIFTTLNQFVGQLKEGHGTDAGQARLNNVVNRLLVSIDQALGKVLEVRANVGARLNALESQGNINESVKIQVKTILSDVEDLDYGQAVSDLNLKLTGLQASQKAFTRVQDISLFDYI